MFFLLSVVILSLHGISLIENLLQKKEKSPEILMCRTPKELYDNCGICGYSTPWNSEEILWYLYDFF